MKIKVINKINDMGEKELKALVLEIFHLEETGVYPKNSQITSLGREMSEELEGIELNHAKDMVKSQVLRIVAKKYISK